MGVAVEADECGLGGEVRFGLCLVVDVVKAGGFIEGGVGERDGIDVCGDRDVAKPGFLGFAELLIGKLEWLAD